jgi:hypothetical protein
MAHRDTLFQNLVRIARRNAACLQAYRVDLWVHDQYTLQYSTSRGDEYVWILREHGTELFRLYQGAEPITVEFWLKPEYRLSRAYHVVCTGDGGYGTVDSITHERAVQLAREPQRGPLKLTPRERELTEHLRKVIACAGYPQIGSVLRAQEFIDRLDFRLPIS